MDFWDTNLRASVRALIPEVEGKPCFNVGAYDGGIYVCRRLSGLGTDEDCLNGVCDRVDPPTRKDRCRCVDDLVCGIDRAIDDCAG